MVSCHFIVTAAFKAVFLPIDYNNVSFSILVPSQLDSLLTISNFLRIFQKRYGFFLQNKSADHYQNLIHLRKMSPPQRKRFQGATLPFNGCIISYGCGHMDIICSIAMNILICTLMNIYATTYYYIYIFGGSWSISINFWGNVFKFCQMFNCSPDVIPTSSSTHNVQEKSLKLRRKRVFEAVVNIPVISDKYPQIKDFLKCIYKLKIVSKMFIET